MKLIKEIILFIFNTSMLIVAFCIIILGGKSLGIGVFSLIPFLYLFYFFTKDLPEKDEKIKQLQDNLEYYKNRIAQYENTKNN